MTRYTISLWGATRTGAVTTPDGLRAGDLAYCSISVKGHCERNMEGIYLFTSTVRIMGLPYRVTERVSISVRPASTSWSA